MAASFIASVGNNADGNSANLDATASLNVAAGDVLVMVCKWEGSAATVAGGKSTDLGTNSFTFPAGARTDHANGDLHLSIGYVLSATADATFTPRFNLSASRTFRRQITLQFRPDSGDTVTFEAASAGTGDSATPSSGNATAAGDDLICVGAFGEYFAGTTDTEQINGVGATEATASPQASGTSAWWRIVGAGFTGAATANIGVTEEWACSLLVLSSDASGGGDVEDDLSGSAATSAQGSPTLSIAVSLKEFVRGVAGLLVPSRKLVLR